jgi:hypothetical protein
LPTASSPRQPGRCAGFIKPATHPDGETAKRPEPLCPTSVLPRWGRRVAISSVSVTSLSSLLRAHASIPLPLRSCGFLPRSRSLCRLPLSPCCQPDVPDVISANLSPNAWSSIPTVPPSPLTCSFLDLIGLPSTPLRSASRISHQHDFSVVKFRAWQTFRYVQAAEFARLPDHSYRCKLAAGQLRLLLPGTTCFVTSARTGYAIRPNTGN